MKLSEIANIQSGHHSRGIITPQKDGSHLLLQPRDVDSHRFAYRIDTLTRFKPALSRKDWLLKTDDVLFMARGARNYSVLLQEIPDSVLAAACFFIVRLSRDEVLPGYLCWYLNQTPAERYFRRHSGRGVHMPVVRRSVLENLDIPLPSVKIQKKIEELEALRKEEEDLTNRLAEKRKLLITASCLKAIRESS
jgi:hypothetical protein